MTVGPRQALSGSVLPLSLFIIGMIVLGDPILGFSQLLPDGIFSLIPGIALLAGSAFLYCIKQARTVDTRMDSQY